MFYPKRAVLLLLITVGLISGCTENPSTAKSAGGGTTTTDTGTPLPTGNFATQCGTVVDGSLTNPASPGDGFRSRVIVISSNLVSVNLPTGPLLVKLHGLGTPSKDAVASSARRVLEDLAREDGIFIPAGADCTTNVPGGGTGALGQLFTASGVSYSETLISRGLSSISSDPCGGSLLRSCYNALQEEAESTYAGEIGRLLWKPQSDSDGRLAIHTGPHGTTVVVNGETGTNRGPGNGYGSLARFSKSGCGYGSNVQVQVFDRKGAAYTFNGSTTITIATGCSRHCLEGSNLSQCVKR